MPQVNNETEFTESANFVTHYTHNLLINMGVGEKWIDLVNLIIVLVAAIIIALVLQKTGKIILTFLFKKLYKITKLSFFKYAVEKKLPHYVALVVPYIFLINSVPTIFDDYRIFIKPALKVGEISMVFIIIWILVALIKTFAKVIQDKPAFQKKPMKSYIQVMQIIFYMFGSVVIFSILTGKSATVFFTAMGAASAVLILMFKDTIMGFMSSIQISTNQMVMLGDWITMSKYGADGEVLEINLTTVKVRNFDKTITTIPTYALISDSFQNWRGMEESGGRRIKRSFNIKQSEIRVLTDSELDEFEKTPVLSDYIKTKRKQYSEWNERLNIDSNSLLKGFTITNCDLYMCYATWYLRNHPEINQELTLMVRQLTPTTQGLPIEVYAFATTTAGAEYERITSEIFNHLISNVGIFGLTIFEVTTGSDGLNVKLEYSNRPGRPEA